VEGGLGGLLDYQLRRGRGAGRLMLVLETYILRLEGACFGVMSLVGRIGNRSYPWKVREMRALVVVRLRGAKLSFNVL